MPLVFLNKNNELTIFFFFTISLKYSHLEEVYMKGKNISKLISVFFIIMAMLFSCNTVADEGDVKNTSTEKETTSDLNNKEEQDSGKKDPVTPGDDTTDDVVIPDDDATDDVVISDSTSDRI